MLERPNLSRAKLTKIILRRAEKKPSLVERAQHSLVELSALQALYPHHPFDEMILAGAPAAWSCMANEPLQRWRNRGVFSFKAPWKPFGSSHVAFRDYVSDTDTEKVWAKLVELGLLWLGEGSVPAELLTDYDALNRHDTIPLEERLAHVHPDTWETLRAELQRPVRDYSIGSGSQGGFLTRVRKLPGETWADCHARETSARATKYALEIAKIVAGFSREYADVPVPAVEV